MKMSILLVAVVGFDKKMMFFWHTSNLWILSSSPDNASKNTPQQPQTKNKTTTQQQTKQQAKGVYRFHANFKGEKGNVYYLFMVA